MYLNAAHIQNTVTDLSTKINKFYIKRDILEMIFLFNIYII